MKVSATRKKKRNGAMLRRGDGAAPQHDERAHLADLWSSKTQRGLDWLYFGGGGSLGAKNNFWSMGTFCCT
jgi:hypothetical protein